MDKTSVSLAGIKAAIFDMDGTMINNAEYHKRAWQEFLRRHDIELTGEEFKQKVSGKMNDQILELVFGKKLDAKTERSFAEDKEALYRELFKHDIQEIAGLSKVIAELHMRGIRTAIATSAPAKNRDFALKELELEGEFEVIIGEEHISQGKPDPEVYLVAARALKVAPSECLVFEDSLPGVVSGKSAGMTVVGILSSHTADELHGTDYAVTDFTEIDFS